jgi:hypothetical protein
MQPRIGRVTGWACGLLLAVLALPNAAAAAAQENTGPNANLLRQASGRYTYRTLTDGRERGVEAFDMFVHRDGSRTLMIWHDLWAKNAQFTVVLRVAENFRPLSAFVSYWVADGYKGNATFRVDDDRINASAAGDYGVVLRTTNVPDEFSIGTHPVAGDGWHLWYAPADKVGANGKINLYSLEATADTGKPPLGEIVEMTWEYVGDEILETPAGRFETKRYRMMGSTDVWITGPDRILVRMLMERFDREYLLTELDTIQH